MTFPVQVDTVRIYRGDDVILGSMELTDDSNNSPIDLSGHTFHAQWRPDTDSNISVPLAVDTSRAAQGIIVISISSEQSASVNSRGVWDVQSVRDGKTRTWLRGRTTFQADVTR